MEGSATKDLELIDSHQDLRKSSSIVSRIYVEGYDTSLSGFDLVISMKKHFASCGEVLHVHIPGHIEGFVLNRFALIYLRGEGAEDKALELSGRSYSRGGNKLVVKPYPFRAKNPDRELARELARTRKEDKGDSRTMYVDGYETSRPVDYLESMLFKHFSRCGQVLFVQVPKEDRVAYVDIMGIHAIEKALQLCRCDVEGLENVKVCGVENPPEDGSLGCGMKVRSWPPEFDLPVMYDATAPEDPNLPKPPPWEPLVYSKGPPSSVIIRYAREDPSLPKPWKGLVDLSTGFKYFWNTETNVTQYKRPLSSSSNYNLRKRVRR